MSRFPPTVAPPPLPPKFVQHFIQGGWRELERVYGCRTALLMKWMEMAGGIVVLQERRRVYLRDRIEQARGNNCQALGIALAAVSRRRAHG